MTWSCKRSSSLRRFKNSEAVFLRTLCLLWDILDDPNLLLDLHDILATSQGGADYLVAKSLSRVLTKPTPLNIQHVTIAIKSVPAVHLGIGFFVLAVEAGKGKVWL